MRYKMPKLNLFLFFALLFIYGISCKNKVENEKDENAGMYETKEFKDFYERFGTDSVYQMQHVVFPLEGIRAMRDSLDIPDPNFKWQEDKWIVHGLFDDMNGTFIREFLSMKGIVIEKITDQSGTFTMERRFAKLASGWNLIYYREMGRY